MEVKGSEVQGHAWLCTEFEADRGYVRPYKPNQTTAKQSSPQPKQQQQPKQNQRKHIENVFVITPSSYWTRRSGHTYKLLSESGDPAWGILQHCRERSHSETLKIGRGFNSHQTQNYTSSISLEGCPALFWGGEFKLPFTLLCRKKIFLPMSTLDPSPGTLQSESSTCSVLILGSRCEPSHLRYHFKVFSFSVGILKTHGIKFLSLGCSWKDKCHTNQYENCGNSWSKSHMLINFFL